MSDPPRACEICEGSLVAWRLGPGDEVDRCGSCGHVQRDLGRCPAQHRDLAYGGDPGFDRVRLALTYRRLRAVAKRSRPAGRPLRVFDAGYGGGGLLRRFLDDGAEVGGADPGALRTEVDPVVAQRGEVIRHSVSEVREGLGSYDLVLGVHVIEHVPDPWSFARSCAALLRPGGDLVLVTPAADGLSRWGSAWWMLEDPTHVRFFSDRSLRLLLIGSGLVREQVTRPLLDSLSVEAASVARRREHAQPSGALTARRTRLLAAAGLPLVIPARALRPTSRPSLQGVASNP